MKRIFLFCFLLPLFCFSQKVMLIDRQLEKPVTYVDTISMKNIERGYFLVYEKDIADIIKNVETLRTVVESKKSIPAKMKSAVAGSTYFNATGGNNKYSIILDTKADMMGAFFVLAHKNKSNEENLANIDKFLAYLRSSKS